MDKTRQVWLKLIVILLGVVMITAVRPVYADTDWHARYWNNQTLSGDPVVDTYEGTKLDHNWGEDAPAAEIDPDNFSARWTRSFSVSPGTYRFTATTDDGMRVWVDGTQIIDVWYDTQVHSVYVDLYLNSDLHHIRVEYYEAGGNAVAQVTWTPTSSVSGTGSWYGEYYNNTDLSGTPAQVRYDNQINFNWSGSPATGVDPDVFSVRWTRSMPLESGTYRFTVTADDGVRLWVNNQLIIDAWQLQSATFTADITLPGGNIPVVMTYFENGGQAVAQLSWAKISQTAAPPPSATTIVNWRAEYFNNIDLVGNPILVRDDAAINFIWGSSSPAPNVVQDNHFSTRWSQTVPFNAGRYQFTVYADDGVRLWVNNQLLVDQWQVQSVTMYSAVIDLPAGQIPIVMEYYEYTGLAEARLDWSVAGATTSSTTTTSSSQPTITGDKVATMTGARHLSVRSGPGLEHDAFTYLSNGQMVELIGRDAFAVWIEIRLADGTTGWVSGRFLSSSYPFNDLPQTS